MTATVTTIVMTMMTVNTTVAAVPAVATVAVLALTEVAPMTTMVIIIITADYMLYHSTTAHQQADGVKYIVVPQNYFTELNLFKECFMELLFAVFFLKSNMLM